MAGTQTLSRGISALEVVAERGGVTAQEIANLLDVHRTVAYRLLTTLEQHHLVYRGEDKLYRPGAGLAALGNSFDRGVRLRSLPLLRRVAKKLRASVALLAAEGDEAVAVAVIVPPSVPYVLSFNEGSRHPIERGAAGIVLLSMQPPRPGERVEVTVSRKQGWARSFGEVEPNTFGLAVPVHRSDGAPPMCINLITHREDVLDACRQTLADAGRELGQILSVPPPSAPRANAR